MNGFFHGLNYSEKQSASLTKLHNKLNKSRQPTSPAANSPISNKLEASIMSKARKAPPPPLALHQTDQLHKYRSHERPGTRGGSYSSYPPSPTSTLAPDYPFSSGSQAFRPTPPPGFALAQLLPGKNIRLTIRIPRIVHWRTGQYTSLTIPSISTFQGHPFTIANADERQIREVNAVGSEMVLVVGVRNGFTKKLWNEIVARRKIFGPAAAASSGGVLIRAQVGIPTGTAGRANLDDFASVLIICGGTGISMGMAVMEHVCMSMATRDADRTGTSKRRKCLNKRVRIVWVLREFGQSRFIFST